MIPPSTQSPAHDELRSLVHGPCDPAFLASLHQALRPETESEREPEPAPAAGRGPDPDAAPPGRGQRPAPGPGSGPSGADLVDLGDRDARLARLMRRLARVLPTARAMARAPEQQAALLAWSAVADPALCMTLVTHQLLCLGSMVRLGGEDRDELKHAFDALESGRTRGAYLVTEAGRANSHLATRTRAVFDPATREFVLDTPDPAAAKFAGVAARGVPRTGAVLARLTVEGRDRGVFAFLVDLTDRSGPLPGVEISSPIELGAVPLDYAQVRFHGVRLPYGRWLRDSASLSRAGVFHDPLGSTDARLARTLCVGQELWAALPSAAAAVARQSAVLALRYSRGRTTDSRLAPGTPLLGYRTQQVAVLGAFADAFALTCAAARARTLLYEAMPYAATGPAPHRGPSASAGSVPGDTGSRGKPDDAPRMGFAPWAGISRPLSAYKAHTVRAAAAITAECRSHCGFSGHLDVNRLAGYHAFHHAFDAAGGDSRLILFDIGRALATEAPAEAEAQAEGPVPLPPGPADPQWWPAVARAHERRLTDRLRRRHQERAAAGRDEFETWNPLLAEAGELGEAHAARLAADDLARTLESVRDPLLRSVLEPLAALHGLLAARRRAGALLTAGTLRPADLDGQDPLLHRLCDALLPHLPLLEEAFAYPQDLVGAPLGAPDFNEALAGSLTWTHGGPP